MKRLQAVVFAVFLSLSACGNGSDDSQDDAELPEITSGSTFVPGTLAAEFITAYEAEGLGFSAEFPTDWRVEDESDLGVVSFIAPQVPGDDFIENFTVAVSPLPGDIPLDEVARLDSQRLQASVANYEVIGGGESELGGLPAVSVVYRGSVEGIELSFLHVLAIQNDKAYDFTFSASEGQFDNFLPVMEQLLSGFRFTG